MIYCPPPPPNDAKLCTLSTTPTSDDEENIFSIARPAQHAHDTFYGVLGAVFADFMQGDFEMIRMSLSTYFTLHRHVH